MTSSKQNLNAVRRYSEDYIVLSPLNFFDDTLNLLEYLVSPEYTIRILKNTHKLSQREAEIRLPSIIAHTRLGLNYLRSARDSPDEIVFNSGYYAVLNLLKVYILFGNFWQELENNRHHGISYDQSQQPKLNFLDQQIILNKTGAVPLLYKTITSNPIANKTIVNVVDFYKNLSMTRVEYQLATNSFAERCIAVEKLTIEHKKMASLQIFLLLFIWIMKTPIRCRLTSRHIEHYMG